jgi:hypothetical protein
MRRLVSVLALLGAVVAQVVLIAAPANAWEVRITITGAGQVTETTPANLVGSTCTTSGNTPTGAVGATSFAGSPSGDYGSFWEVDYLATPKPGYRFVRWESDGTTRAGVICDRSDPPATGTTYTGTSCKFRTFENLQVRAVFEDVTAPTMASLSGPTGPVGGSATFYFSASSDPTVTGFECRVAGVHDWVACSSGRTENPASSGTYTFEVRAVDASGNRSDASTWQWTVDKNPPETTPVSGPTGTVASTSATFHFTRSEAGSYRCSLDMVQLASCDSPRTLTGLTQGGHLFTAAAVDQVGNVDPTPVSWTWTVDTIAPDTSITSGPDPLTRSTSADFELTATEQGGDFLCTLDGEPEPCAGPHEVAEGNHAFTVAARDAVGNTDATPASWTWLVDTTAPVVASRAPTGRRVGTGSNVVVTFSEAMQEASVEASRNGKPLAVTLSLGLTKVPATVTYTETTNGAFRAVLDPARRLRAGKEYRARVTSRALDLAGNPVLPFSWTFRTRG